MAYECYNGCNIPKDGRTKKAKEEGSYEALHFKILGWKILFGNQRIYIRNW